jgi:hypothetical protein
MIPNELDPESATRQPMVPSMPENAPHACSFFMMSAIAHGLACPINEYLNDSDSALPCMAYPPFCWHGPNTAASGTLVSDLRHRGLAL